MPIVKETKKYSELQQKYVKYFINFLKNVKCISVHNRKVACSRDGARDFFYSLVNNALSPSRADAKETV